MLRRRLNVRAKVKDRVTIDVSALITTETGALSPYEIDRLKKMLADGVMHTLAGLPYFTIHISEIKVSR
jgi:hypothetical protein